MKKMFAALLMVFVMLTGTAMARDYYYWDCEYYEQEYATERNMTTMVVADANWDFNVQVNARREPDIDAKPVTVIDGGTQIEVYEFYYSGDDRIWAKTWIPGYGYAHVSMRYLQPLKEGSFFQLNWEYAEVHKYPDDESKIIATFSPGLVRVDKIVYDAVENKYWGKVLADGYYGYVSMIMLDPMM